MKSATKTRAKAAVKPRLTASAFLDELFARQSISEIKKMERFFKDAPADNKFIGMRMADIFSLAKKFMQMPLSEIEKLVGSKYYEARMGAVSVMDFRARDKKTPSDIKKNLFELYIKRHDRINNWDLVDRSAPYVVGGYLFDKPRNVLYKLAKSKNVWERRTAIVSTYFFIRKNETADTFKIAELLLHDKHELIHKATGSWIREAGKRDKQKLLDFLDKFSAKMPRTMLRYAIEKLDKKQKECYMSAYKQISEV